MQSAFELFVEPSILQNILKWTNKEGNITYGNKWIDLDREEFECFLGLLILAGVYKGHNEGIVNLWNTEHGRNIFNSSIARKRFTEISTLSSVR